MGDLTLARARGRRWLPARRVHTISEAAEYVADVGFALLFPGGRPAAPALWEAVAGVDVEPFAHGMGPLEARVWTWKDEFARDGLAWYGRFLYRRASLLSPPLLAALYPGEGEPDDHRAFALSPEAHRIAEALALGPLPTSTLRAVIGHRGRYERAIGELHRLLLVTSAGVREHRTGWPAAVVDLTCRRFDVGGGTDHGYAAARFLDTMVEASPATLATAFGWPVPAATAALDGLVVAGLATAGRTYRPKPH